MMTERNEKYIPALSFDFLTPFYDTAVKWTTRETVFKEKLVGQIEIPEDGRLLDLACGTATLTIALKRKFPKTEIHGLDGDAKILKIARRKAEDSGAEINFTESFSTSLPYANEHFDAIFSSLFFHHLTPENKQKTLLEVRRVLKASGTLHIADWGNPSNLLMKLASMPIQWLDGATTKDSYAGKLPEIMAEAGFSNISETADFNTAFGTLRLHRAEKRKLKYAENDL
jgi:ubiquinone/menaquinone biosynthesis C-methylase UbiE